PHASAAATAHTATPMPPHTPEPVGAPPPLRKHSKAPKPPDRPDIAYDPPAKATAIAIPTVYATEGSNSNSTSRVGIHGKLCRFAANGVPSTSCRFHAG